MLCPDQLPKLSDIRAAQQKFQTQDLCSESPVLYKDECFAIVGAAIEVQKALGHGFSEMVYHEASCCELASRGIPYESEKEIRVMYKGKPLNTKYRADIVCYDDIIVELKMVSTLLPEHTAQVLNYLKATNKALGILINFGQTPLGRKLIPNHITR